MIVLGCKVDKVFLQAPSAPMDSSAWHLWQLTVGRRTPGGGGGVGVLRPVESPPPPPGGGGNPEFGHLGSRIMATPCSIWFNVLVFLGASQNNAQIPSRDTYNHQATPSSGRMPHSRITLCISTQLNICMQKVLRSHPHPLFGFPPRLPLQLCAVSFGPVFLMFHS